ncbi:hypothetical protein BDQ12DRAFT_685562 [Crucibulum laeve]|uniref:Ser-Thr-rich glycosyl-phosphatidyl-inositol-anchored membrane family-domain-containing protein n=1 Tax=Crucibulum laeve TaxID=68775 RepID=A0A5C3LXX0_9AGAR|nr:hypothetical protein BDQ12DRAFT_685562 [Crucibulum laeve]
MQFLSSMKTMIALLAISLASSPVGAVPAQQSTNDVFVPPVLTPTAGTIWKVGTQQTVTWDVSNPPVHITNAIGEILMSKGGVTIPNLTIASNFSILLGTINVQVPNLAAGNDYRVILFGDSGNTSPAFSIIQ